MRNARLQAYHPRASGFLREFLCHEAVNECTVDHEAQHEPCPLNADCSKGDRNGVDAFCCSCSCWDKVSFSQ